MRPQVFQQGMGRRDCGRVRMGRTSLRLDGLDRNLVCGRSVASLDGLDRRWAASSLDGLDRHRLDRGLVGKLDKERRGRILLKRRDGSRSDLHLMAGLDG